LSPNLSKRYSPGTRETTVERIVESVALGPWLVFLPAFGEIAPLGTASGAMRMATTFEKWETDINERENTQYENENNTWINDGGWFDADNGPEGG
jgi:hypothetical protein